MRGIISSIFRPFKFLFLQPFCEFSKKVLIYNFFLLFFHTVMEILMNNGINGIKKHRRKEQKKGHFSTGDSGLAISFNLLSII